MAVSYRPIKALASGGMADVYLGVQASDTGFNRLCAIKKIKSQSTNDDEFISMFLDEAKICQTLQHANVVQVIDFTTMDDSCALIMEFIQGANLSSLLKKFRTKKSFIDTPVALFIGAEVARGLHYVHTRTDPMTDQNLGIVHRDISPSNVLISYEGEVKITDFGIAKAQDNSHKTQVGVIKGKYQYMSPEQFQGRPIDKRTDIFALGCILWEALAGRKMFNATSEAHLLQLVMQGPPTASLSQFNPDIPEELNHIIQKSIHIDPNQRYQSAGELAHALTDYSNSHFQQFNSLTLAEYTRENLKEELDVNKQLVKEVLEIFNNTDFENDAGNEPTAIFTNPASSPSNASRFDLKGFSTNSKSKVQIKDAPFYNMDETTPMSKPNLEAGKAKGAPVEAPQQEAAPKAAPSAKGLELEDVDFSLMPQRYAKKKQDPQKSQGSHLGWTQQKREITQTRRIKVKHKQRSNFLGRFFFTMSFLLIIATVSAAVVQYGMGVDVIGHIKKLSAKIKMPNE